MSKHTPGPWKVNETDYSNAYGIECEVNGIGHTVVTDQFCYPNFKKDRDPEKLANAKLIASAPELLEALKGLVNDVKNKPNDTRYATHIKIAEEAIKKASS